MIVNTNGFHSCRNHKAFIIAFGIYMVLITATRRHFYTFS